MAFDATLKGTTSNSYVTVEEADAYFDMSMDYAKWEQLSVKDKQRFLVSATSRLDIDQFGGRRTATAQLLQWPRLWIIDRNFSQNQDFVEYIGGNYYLDPETMPLELKTATFELALWYIKEFLDEDPLVSRNDQSRMTSYQIRPLKTALRNIKEDALPDKVIRALKGMSENGWYGGNQMRLVR